ncbi:MAG: hypothetical protein ABI877_03980 [Gemmatimonadaceae bacterium]
MAHYVILGILLFGAMSCAEPTAPSELAPNTTSGLRVWATVTPSALSVRDSLTPIVIRVYARNPGDDTLRIVSGGPPYTFTSDPRDSRGLSYGFRIARNPDSLNAGPNADFWGQPVYVFAPHSTSYVQHQFSLKTWRAGGWSTDLGEYEIRSFYNGREGQRATLQLLR